MRKAVVVSPQSGQRKGLENLDFVVSALPPLQVGQRRQFSFKLLPGTTHPLVVEMVSPASQ